MAIGDIKITAQIIFIVVVIVSLSFDGPPARAFRFLDSELRMVAQAQFMRDGH